MSDKDLKKLVASLAVESKRTDEQMRQTAEQMKRTDEKMEKLNQETREQMRQTDEQMKRTDEKLERVGIRLGSISNNQGDVAEEFFWNTINQGDVAEEFFWNTISANPTIGGIKYDYCDKNITRSINKGKISDEFDIVMINGQDITIIETKYKAHQNDVIKLIQKKYNNFKILYPEYKNYKHHLALASFNINDKVKEEALKNNIMLLQRKGKLIETTMPTSTKA